MDDKLEVIIWDVQHGNAIYINTPNGTRIFFDIGTGSYEEEETFSPLNYLKYKRDVKRIDYLSISHPHADHISDIKTLFDENMKPQFLLKPTGLSEEFIREANQNQFSEIIDLYLELVKDYSFDVSWDDNPRNPKNNGGVKIHPFSQGEKGMDNLNNYSIVAVVEYEGEKIIIPGDIETVGWKVLLEKEDFKESINGTTILVASHHGRESGFCKEIFEYFRPDIVVISDGRFSDTSATDRYSYYAKGAKVRSRSTNEENKRYVLTTRNDGAIYIAGIEENERVITIK